MPNTSLRNPPAAVCRHVPIVMSILRDPVPRSERDRVCIHSSAKALLGIPRIPHPRSREGQSAGQQLTPMSSLARSVLILSTAIAVILGIAALTRHTMPREQWVCDMHCEPGKISAHPGVCPLCHMALRPFAEVPFLLAPPPPTPFSVDTPTRLTFNVRDPAGLPARQIPGLRAQGLDLVIVSDDLRWFSLAKGGAGPSQTSTGLAVSTTVAPPGPGRYMVYPFVAGSHASETHLGGIAAVPLFFSGASSEPLEFKETYDEVQHDGAYELRIRCNGKRFFAGEDSFLRVGVDLNGKTVTDLEPVDGAEVERKEMGELFIASADRMFSVKADLIPVEGSAQAPRGVDRRTIPEEVFAEAKRCAGFNGSASDLIFHARFPRPGFYVAIARLQHQGRVLTASFLIDAQPKEGMTDTAPEPHHHPSAG